MQFEGDALPREELLIVPGKLGGIESRKTFSLGRKSTLYLCGALLC